MTKKLFALFLLSVLLAGCVSSRITNLTATTQPRNLNNLYLIEFQWDTTQQTLRPESIKPYVVTGFDTYEMRPVLRMTNRWEALVPMPPGQNTLTYRIKVDYQYNQFGPPGHDSKLSPDYKLTAK
jgi:hypothetical protein